MDIYDGTDWIEMDIEDLKAAIAHGASIEVAAEHLCRAGSTDDGPGNAASLGWSLKEKPAGVNRRAGSEKETFIRPMK